MTIAAIRQFLKHPDCIVFVGSGISMWSGLPSWSGLMGELATFLEEEGQSSELVRREMLAGELLQAASYGVSKLTPTAFATFMRRVVQHGAASPHALHKAIVELGPTSFVTTNYDTLIEQALRTWRTDAFFRAPVTNKHLVELADIVSARSSHFIFKPHGDIDDISSIILTREQYRTLMPGGERHRALEMLKTLLVTRPVLYVGFGLRDPDFIYLRELLLNIYQGAVRDHWAIIPDVGSEEVDYWRNQYGIKLLGYKTYEDSNGSRDHRDLLPLIQALTAPDIAATAPASGHIDGPSETERVLALTRYTSGLIRRVTPTNPPIEACISRALAMHSAPVSFDTYQNWTTTRFLIDGPQSAFLTGLPGSGKSFALRLAALQLAKELQQACMDDTLTAGPLTLPVLLDLKLYRGDLLAQIDAELPAGFSLDRLRGNLRLKLFLDAFNEMPSEYLENGGLFKSLEVLKNNIGDFDYAITSRTRDGLPEQSYETIYEIDRFERSHVAAVLAEHSIILSGRFVDDIWYLLSRPFFLHLVIKGLIEVPEDARPRDLFASYMEKLQQAFSDRFETNLSLLAILSKVAYRAIEDESEAFPLAWFSDLFNDQISNTVVFTADEVINWLISREVLIPYTGRRASFIHQSITEYCAATELARRSRIDTVSLRDTIASKKWDQCLFLALALMEPKIAETVLNDTIEADLWLAVNAARYAEEGQSAAVTRLLAVLVDRVRKDGPEFTFLYLRHLPVGPEHVDLLRELLAHGGSIAGEAVRLIAQVLGVDFKPELLDLLEAHADDFNFSVNGARPALRALLDESDLPRLIEIAKAWEAKGLKDGCSAIGDLVARFDLEEVLRHLEGQEEILSPGMAELLADGLRNRGDDAALMLLAELLLLHPDKVASSFSLAFNKEYKITDPVKYCFLGPKHIDAIWQARSNEVLWDSGLSSICEIRPDLKPYVEVMAATHHGIEAIALRYCASGDNEALFAELELLLVADDATLKDQPFELLRFDELDWKGRETLLMQSLVRELPRLRKALLRSSYRYMFLDSGSINLALMRPVIALAETKLQHPNDWFAWGRLGEIVAHLGDREVQDFCLHALVHGSEPLRNWVKQAYLCMTKNISSDALDDEMIAILLADLGVPNSIVEYWYNPLGNIATDRFVQERLLPLAEGASTEFRKNLSVVLKAAGDRHGKRYLL